MKNKSLTKFKFENATFVILIALALFNATLYEPEITNPFGIYAGIVNLIFDVVVAYGAKYLLFYIRKNPRTIYQSIVDMFKDN